MVCGDPCVSLYEPTQHFSQTLFGDTGPSRRGGGGGGISLCKPFIPFQAVSPQPSTIQLAHSTVLGQVP